MLQQTDSLYILTLGISHQWQLLVCSVSVSCENKFCAPDQIGKTKRRGSGGTGSLKFFKNTFESLGFIHITIHA